LEQVVGQLVKKAEATQLCDLWAVQMLRPKVWRLNRIAIDQAHMVACSAEQTRGQRSAYSAADDEDVSRPWFVDVPWRKGICFHEGSLHIGN
jgi:hypothetical protein